METVSFVLMWFESFTSQKLDDFYFKTTYSNPMTSVKIKLWVSDE